MVIRISFRFLLVCALGVFVQSCGSKSQSEIVYFSDVDTSSFLRGDTVLPFSYIVPKQKGWRVVIEISGDDYESTQNATRGRMYITSKPQVLNLIRNWRFIYTGGDLATVTSSILVYRDGTLVDQQGIVLDEDQVGLQSIKYGWITPLNRDEVYRSLRLMEEKSF